MSRSHPLWSCYDDLRMLSLFVAGAALQRVAAHREQGVRMSSAGPLIGDDEASAEIRALYSDIRASHGVGLIINFWRALANDPPTLRRMWDSFNSTMAPGALDPLTKELVFLAVSATNGCAYCTAAHGTAAKTQGMSSEIQFATLQRDRTTCCVPVHMHPWRWGVSGGGRTNRRAANNHGTGGWRALLAA